MKVTNPVRELSRQTRKINERVTPILVAYIINDVICLSRSEKVAEFGCLPSVLLLSLPSKVVKTMSNYTQKVRG